MTTIASIAQRILDENAYTLADISLTNLEYLIDNAIDYINMQAGITIVDLSGSAETKSLTATEPQIFAVKSLGVLMLRAYKDKGPQVGIGSLNVSFITSDPQYSLFMQFVEKAIDRLKSLPIVIKNDPLPNE